MFVIYDFTRLDQRRNFLTPTGVDRVDLYYILFLLKTYSKIIFVRGYGGYLKTYPTQNALDLLKKIAKNWAEIDDISYNIDRNDFINAKMNVEKFLKDDINYTYFNLTHSLLIGRYTIAKFAIKDNIKMIYFCHDIIPILYPEYTREGKDELHCYMMELMLRSADLILTTSQAVKQDVLNYSQEIGVHPPKVIAKEIGVEENFLKARWNKQDCHRHFIYVGTFEPRKNHILLFLAWKKLYSILQEKTPMLYIIGRKGWLIDWLDRYFEVEPNVSRFVKRLENIQDSQLEKLMLESYATLNPSYTEGWGMPVAESVAMGIPTICSDIPAYHESSQECAIFLSPLNIDIWVDVVLGILNNTVVFPNNVYKSFAWESYFNEIQDILNKRYLLRNKSKHMQSFCEDLEKIYFALHKARLRQSNKNDIKNRIKLSVIKLLFKYHMVFRKN